MDCVQPAAACWLCPCNSGEQEHDWDAQLAGCLRMDWGALRAASRNSSPRAGGREGLTQSPLTPTASAGAVLAAPVRCGGLCASGPGQSLCCVVLVSGGGGLGCRHCSYCRFQVYLIAMVCCVALVWLVAPWQGGSSRCLRSGEAVSRWERGREGERGYWPRGL